MLSGKQKRYLRSLAVNKKPMFQIGKDGLTDNLYDGISDALKVHELIKINVLKSCALTMNEIIVEICANTNSELVQEIGKTIVIYKPSKERKIKI